MLLLFPLLLLAYVVAGLGISLLGARSVARRFKSYWLFCGIFTLLFTLIFGDEIYGYIYWKNLCKAQGGLHVSKQVPVEGFFIEGDVSEGVVRDYLKPSYFSKDVYQFIEGKDKGRLYKFTAGPGSAFDIQREAILIKASKFSLSSMRFVQYPHYVWSVEYSISDSSTNEQLGIERSFGYKGSTIIRLLRKITGADFEGSASYCPNSRLDIVRTVIPHIEHNNIGGK